MGNGVRQFKIAAQECRDAVKADLVATAKREHALVMKTDPKPTSFTRMVDGVLGANEESVKPNGVIVYAYPRLAEAVEFALATLRDLSPVLSGEYRNGHHLFVNDVMVPNLDTWDGQSTVVICNYVPYARKIELGKMTMRRWNDARL